MIIDKRFSKIRLNTLDLSEAIIHLSLKTENSPLPSALCFDNEKPEKSTKALNFPGFYA